jgi:3'(2'), 5'-bisphosphate nucleotidase
MFRGARGIGAHEVTAGRVREIKVRAAPADGPIAVASASHRDAATDNWLKANRIDQTVSIGSSLKFCLMAAGEADVYPRFGPTMEWDTAAGDAVLRAAGGSTTNIDGNPFVYGKAGYRNTGFIAYGRWRPEHA